MAVSQTMRFTILARDGFECVYCHTKDKPLEVDHIRPRSMGGNDEPENLVAACADCNRGKANASLNRLHTVPRPKRDGADGAIAALDGDARGLLPKARAAMKRDRSQREVIKYLERSVEAQRESIRILHQTIAILEARSQPSLEAA